MGGALARRLQIQQPLLVHDLDITAVRRLVDNGAVACDSLGDLAERCEVIFLCLPTSDHVRSVIFADDGLAASAKPGTVIVDQTSGDPKATRMMAAQLAVGGIELIDAPVSGGPRGAENGTIAIMVGAEPEQYQRIHPVLASISPNVFHAGAVGTGHTMKLVNNLLSCAQRLLTVEAMALAVKGGIDPHKAVEILLAGGGRNAYLERVMGPDIVNGRVAAGFTLGLAHKDVWLACHLGAVSGVPMFFGNLTRELYQSAINAMGRDAKVDSVVPAMERLTDTHIMPPGGAVDGNAAVA
jgi:3-hydroxyisobutyrate dehydrogenase